jgi:2-oxoglutarate ferredoxin oxidoreductase subunit beta
VAIAAGGTFVARGFSGDIDHLVGLIKSGIQHRGFALIDIVQPCVSFNHKNTHAWYKERVYKLEATAYRPSDRSAAMEKALEWGERIPIGVIYQHDRPAFEDELTVLRKGPLVKQPMDPMQVGALLDEFV